MTYAVFQEIQKVMAKLQVAESVFNLKKQDLAKKHSVSEKHTFFGGQLEKFCARIPHKEQVGRNNEHRSLSFLNRTYQEKFTTESVVQQGN